MKRLFAVLAVLVAAAIIITACGGGGGGGGGGGSSTVSAPANATQAQQAASAGTQGVAVASGSATSFQNFGSVGLTAMGAAPSFKFKSARSTDPGMAYAQKLSGKFAKSKAVAKATAAIRKAKTMKAPVPTTNLPCTDGGTVSFSGTVNDATAAFDLQMTFSHCREDGTDTDGAASVAGSMNASGAFTMTETLGTISSKLVMLEFADASYGLLMAKMESALTLGLSGSINSTTLAVTGAITANGTMDVHDYFSLEDYNMVYSNATIALTFTPGTGGAETFSMEMDGQFSESWSDASGSNSVAMTYTDFILTEEWSATGTLDESISGTFAIDFTPNECFEGGYKFATIAKIHYNANGQSTAGHVEINDVVHVRFNTDGTINVTLEGSGGAETTVVSNADMYDLAVVCDFQTMDEPAPTSSGSGGAASGSSMTVTSQSSGLNLACYTDIHVNYYNTATPTATTPGTWFVDWHTNDASTIPVGSGFQQYRDIDADGTADVGLDINGADTDDTSGGLEHFSAFKLPVGYYVISMNNYSCATDVTNTVSIQIGSSVFGPFNCTYTASDGEGTTPGAWCDVADVVVTSTGATVQAHNPSLELWHNGAFGQFAPKTARGFLK